MKNEEIRIEKGRGDFLSGRLHQPSCYRKIKTKQRRALEILDAAHKLGPFRTPEEIDRQIREERDLWDD